MEEKNQLYSEYIMTQHQLRLDKERNLSEIEDREKTLKEKFARIQDLRKKIQELEKFKFVLDYKIKELRREIGPREIQIKSLKEKVNKMRSEYKHFTRVNSNLALIVEDLRLRQAGLKNEVEKMKVLLEKQDEVKRRFREDLQEMMLKATTDKKLKSGVISLHKRWVLGENREGRIEKDSVKEYELTRSLFENGNRVLKEKIKTNSKNHKEKNARIL
jgi:cilia- and flagella-associated protein 57